MLIFCIVRLSVCAIEIMTYSLVSIYHIWIRMTIPFIDRSHC